MDTGGRCWGKLPGLRVPGRAGDAAFPLLLPRVPTRCSPRRLAALLLLAALPAALPAQRVLGPGDDAWILPPGLARIGFSTRFLVGDEWFDGDGRRQPLGAWLSRDTVGPARFPGLSPLAAALGDATGAPVALSLGAVSADLRRQVQVAPLELAVGVLPRVMLRVRAPFVAAEHQSQWRLDPSGATVGANPARVGAESAARNGALLGALDASASGLDALLETCLNAPSSDPRCGAALADVNGVRALTASTRGLADALGRSYGGGEGQAGAAFVPLDGSAGHTAVLDALAALRTRYASFGDLAFDGALAPVAAGAPATIEDLHALLLDATGPYALGPWGRRYDQGLGDVDLSLWLRAFDGTAGPWRAPSAGGPQLRQSVGATLRLGTGRPGDPDDPLMLATGDGQHDLELASATDLLLGQRFWASALVRYTHQFADVRPVRLPDPLLSPYLPLTRRVEARVEPGARLSVEVAPRWVLNDYLALGGRYRWTREAGSTWTEQDAEGAPLTVTGADRQWQEVTLGVTWSSLAAWQRGRTRRPIEWSYEHARVLDGAGEVLRARSDRLGVTVYAKLWGK